jgi:uncharacterized membrane protein
MSRFHPASNTSGSSEDEARTSNPVGAERDPGRGLTFSDGVFAIAATLLVLQIRPPEDTRHLLKSLGALWPSYAAYTGTFLLIGQMWANHRLMFDHIRALDRLSLLFNTLLLMQIAFLPFASAVLANALRSGHGQRTAVVFYGLSYEVAAILFNVIWEYARHGRRLLVPTTDSTVAASISRRFRPAPVWIAVGIGAGLLNPILGVAVVAAFIPFYWLPIKGETASVTRAREQSAPPSPSRGTP